MDERSYSGSWAQGSRCYKQLMVVDDMNDPGSRELSPLNTMNNLRHWAIWTILGWELVVLNFMNNSGLKTWTTLGRELKALYVMNSSSLWMTWTTPNYELKALDVINNTRLRMTWATPGHELKVMDAMNNLGFWMIWMTRDLVSSSL